MKLQMQEKKTGALRKKSNGKKVKFLFQGSSVNKVLNETLEF
jgi:hypothetical protein